MNVSTSIAVDLLNVSFVDDAGHQLLADIRHAGADLIGSGPMMSALIEEIEETEAEQDDLAWEDSPELNDRKELKQ
jgi:anti-anti-sigma regulatory factor